MMGGLWVALFLCHFCFKGKIASNFSENGFLNSFHIETSDKLAFCANSYDCEVFLLNLACKSTDSKSVFLAEATARTEKIERKPVK